MKVENQDGIIVLKELFAGVMLETPTGDALGLRMKEDGGFEVVYGDKVYRLRDGRIKVSNNSLVEEIKENASKMRSPKVIQVKMGPDGPELTGMEEQEAHIQEILEKLFGGAIRS